MTDDRGSAKPQLALFFAAVMAMGVAMGIHESIFNNFLSDTFDLSAYARGWLEFPRELPGFLVVLMAGILWTLSVTRLGVLGAAIFLVGMTGMVLFGQSYWPMILMMVLASAGHHLLQPVTASIALAAADHTNRGWRMGQMRAMGTIGMIVGSGFVWLVFRKIGPEYRLGFLCAAAVGAATAVCYALMHLPHLHRPRAPLVFRKRYALYYLLELVFGARKQIFITFGPWVLIKVYGQLAWDIALLLLIAAVIGIAFKPLAGLAIDRFGERAIMIADGLTLAVVCLGYGYAATIATPDTARLIACACFIADNLLFALGTARATYLARLTRSHQEITSTLAMGVSINHIASMTIPAAAGALWAAFGYQRVFLAAAILALTVSALSTRVPGKEPSPTSSP